MNVFVSGSFNILHPGHLRLLRFAKGCGSKLIVGVLSDRLCKGSAHLNENLRLEGVLSNSWVDEAYIIDELISVIIKRLKPNIVVKGKEHELVVNEELEALNEYGGKLIFGSGETTFSSFDLLSREFFKDNSTKFELPYDFMERHLITKKKLLSLIEKFKNINVCIVGDLIVDEYITCDPLGMSQEDPTIVVTPVDKTRFLGGAGIVAAHASGLGAKVNFITVTGDDEIRDYALEQLTKAGVNSQLITDVGRPTTLKQRFRCKGKTLLRVSHLHQSTISKDLEDKLIKVLEKVIDNTEIIVFSDFNYGCLTQKTIDYITRLAKSKGVLLAADSQSSSQIGDVSRFKNMNLLTPTEREARISIKNREDGLVILADKLQKESSCENIILKLGEEGLLIYPANNHSSLNFKTDKLESLNPNPKDVSGAGDSLLITSALTLVVGGSIWEASLLGSLAAAIQVGRVGNTSITNSELLNILEQ